ncbi:hypothetical protein Poly51_23480 [Rubripirellula tenax]|uniref:Insertion element IS402-like domain-containing protein n=1 Tax=Rubripirellula tenax TaxID=2528015 RepID=A0A5C6F7L0_9BACT|nr:transposase [Rubripirellula tenax]TWU56437.1 hypothetical protein Poly51_23480 [Rubripirellula tenax]
MPKLLSPKASRRRPNTTGSRTAPVPFITNSQWELIRHLFPKQKITHVGGRPQVDHRACLEGIIWVLKNGARWKDLPERYMSSATCWRRRKKWTEDGTFLKAWQILIRRMDRRKLLHWSQAMGDGTFSPAKKGALKLAKPSVARAQKSW